VPVEGTCVAVAIRAGTTNASSRPERVAQWRAPRISPLPVLAVIAERVFRARRIPTNPNPPQPSTPFSHKTPALVLVLFHTTHTPRHSDRRQSRSGGNARNPKARFSEAIQKKCKYRVNTDGSRLEYLHADLPVGSKKLAKFSIH
jgi:hypothetical protein